MTRSISLDVPLIAPSSSWHEAEGVKFRVEAIDQRGQQTMITLSHTLAEEAAGGENLGQPPYLYAAVPLDERGGQMAVHMANLANRGDGQLVATIFSQTGQPVRPAALRLHIAAAVEERKIDFELRDLDLGLSRPQDKDAEPGRGEDEEAE